MVNPTYKPVWDLPGGMAEANEPPEDTARRELMEELGIRLTLRGLLVVDWVAPHGPWDDQLAFIFDGGTLDEEQADRLEHALKALDTGRPVWTRGSEARQHAREGA
ncbi:NUDIX domain-containing protein [Streptomyces sp. NPDC059868]|uniref:NUDIX domain-containing protein n=1 Tax=unclassified Streptomyces TaxID=2593676 RepID=UPI0036626F4F